MDAARWLRDSGVTIEDLAPAGSTDEGVDAILRVKTGGRSARFAVQAKSRAPYPHELERLKHELKRVTEERDILKKAAAYFAKELP